MERHKGLCCIYKVSLFCAAELAPVPDFYQQLLVASPCRLRVCLPVYRGCGWRPGRQYLRWDCLSQGSHELRQHDVPCSFLRRHSLSWKGTFLWKIQPRRFLDKDCTWFAEITKTEFIAHEFSSLRLPNYVFLNREMYFDVQSRCIFRRVIIILMPPPQLKWTFSLWIYGHLL